MIGGLDAQGQHEVVAVNDAPTLITGRVRVQDADAHVEIAACGFTMKSNHDLASPRPFDLVQYPPMAATSEVNDKLLLGLDIGGTKCAAVVGTRTGDVIDRIEWHSHAAHGPAVMIPALVDNARTLLTRHGNVAAVGVSIGGPLDAAQGIIHSPPNLPGWDAIPLRATLEKELNLPARVEHDAAACGFAEYHWGAGQGAQRLIYLTCGTGFGAGIIFDGTIYRGAQGRPSDIGHIKYRDDGPIAYGRPGTLEAFCSGSGLPKLAAWRFPDRWAATPPTSKELADLARNNDPDAIAIIKINAAAVADACAMLADLLYPDRILLGSLARYLPPVWMETIQSRFKTEAFPAAANLCTIAPAGLGERLQDCSALVVALSAIT